MQKIVKFRVDEDIDQTLQGYLDDNSGETFVSLTPVYNDGDEIIIAVVDDGLQEKVGLFQKEKIKALLPCHKNSNKINTKKSKAQ